MRNSNFGGQMESTRQECKRPVLSRGRQIYMHIFFAFLVCLFTFVAIISAPVVSWDIGRDGISTTTKYHQALKAEDYEVIQLLEKTTVSSSIKPRWLTSRSAAYYSVMITNGPDSGSILRVRVLGKELESLQSGDNADLYGPVSNGYLTATGFVEGELCLNDNGDSVLTLWLRMFAFIACDAGAVLVWRKASRNLKAQNSAARG